jgi:hypothetical protein
LLVFQEIFLSISTHVHRQSRRLRYPGLLVLIAMSGWGAQLQAQIPPPAFQSALEGYKPHTDDGAPEWIKANDAVRQAGGWRAYAREAQGNEAGEVKGDDKSQTKTQTPPTPATPAPAVKPSAPPAGHSGHTKP